MIKLSDYKTIVVDMDGTLYYQKPVRASMLFSMLLHPQKIADFLIVQKYRKLYANGFCEKDRLKQLPDNAAQVIEEWMIQRPLPYIKKFCDAQLIAALKEAQKRGIRIIVYSDYPVKTKLEALGFFPEEAYSAEEIGAMKPNASGILKVMKMNSENKNNILVIGDRDDKDGQLARNIRCDYLILGKTKNARRKQYTI